MTTATTTRRTERWLLLAFAAFCLAVLAANGTMIALAVATWPGLTTVDAYQRGLDYNRDLAAARRQAALGWRAEVTFVPQGDRQGVVELHLVDAAGQPVARAHVTAELVRPSQAGHDLAVSLERRAAGLYRAELAFPLPGAWDIRLRAERGEERYELAHRAMVR